MTLQPARLIGLGEQVMANSILQKRFRQIIREGIDPVLKAAGFVKQGQVYRRQLPELWWVLDVQRSRWNTADECDFTVNVGIHVPRVRSTYYPSYPEPQLPEVSDCIVSCRIGTLNPERKQDLWWTLKIDDDVQETDARIKDEISKELSRHVLPFFKRFQTRRDVIAFLDHLKTSRSEIHGGNHIYPNNSWLSIFLGILYWMESDQEACSENLTQAKHNALASKWGVAEIENLIERICHESADNSIQVLG